MTEIPEHLLKRSKERREAASGSANSGTSETAPAVVSATSAVPQTVASATASVPPPPPDPAYVVAAKTRKKIPFWAMATLSLLPLWALMYLISLSPEEKVVEGPMATGAEIYGSCAGCHGAAGQGGAGRVLSGGEVMKTFPKIEDMLNFVYTGSQPFVSAEIPYYGDPNREGGPHAPLSYNGNPMPMQGEKAGGGLTEYEILGVVCHTRYVLSGADPTSEEWLAEYETWCSPESEIFAALQGGATSFDTVDKDFSMLPKPPTFVGSEARAATK